MSTEFASILIPSSQQSKTRAHLSVILNHDHSDKNPLSDVPRYDRAVSDLSTIINSEEHSEALSSNSSSSKRNQIEMAISQLNMDDDIIRNLKNAFNCTNSSSTVDESGSDAVSALLGLRQTKDDKKFSNTQPIQKRIFPYYAYPTPYKKIIRPQAHVSEYPLHPHSNVTHIRRVKEYLSFAVKLRHNDKFWEIVAFSPDFDERQVKIKLVKSTSQSNGSDTETVIIEATKYLFIRTPNGPIVEKIMSARNVIPLGGTAASAPLVTVVRRGCFKIRLEKKK